MGSVVQAAVVGSRAGSAERNSPNKFGAVGGGARYSGGFRYNLGSSDALLLSSCLHPSGLRLTASPTGGK